MQTKHHPTLLDRVARSWWFYLLLAACFFLPAYTTLPFNVQQTPKLVMEVLSHSVIYSVPFVFPLFKLVPLVVIALLFVQPKRFTQLFYAWAAINLLLIAVFQDMATKPTYGFSVLIGNVIVYIIVSLVFVWATASGKEEPLQFKVLPWWRYWVIPLALLAFWFPANTSLATPLPDFSLARLFLNEAGLTACMMLPVYLAVLTLTSSVNAAVLRVVGFIGFIPALLNVSEFFMNASYGGWLGVVYLPLLLMSLFAFVL